MAALLLLLFLRPPTNHQDQPHQSSSATALLAARRVVTKKRRAPRQKCFSRPERQKLHQEDPQHKQEVHLVFELPPVCAAEVAAAEEVPVSMR